MITFTYLVSTRPAVAPTLTLATTEATVEPTEATVSAKTVDVIPKEVTLSRSFDYGVEEAVVLRLSGGSALLTLIAVYLPSTRRHALPSSL